MLKINFTPFPILTTERLILRQLNIEDENEIFALRTNEKVNKYIDRPKIKSLEEVQKFIIKINNGIKNKDWIFWVVSGKNDFRVMGTITLWKISREDFRAEIGYELLPDLHGNGIMHEALKKVVEYGFNTMNLQTIVAFTNDQNVSSRRLLERNNFVINSNFDYLKTEKERGNGTLIYSMTNKSID